MLPSYLENLTLPEDTFDVLYLISKGDLRKGINFLQIFSKMKIMGLGWNLAVGVKIEIFLESFSHIVTGGYIVQ